MEQTKMRPEKKYNSPIGNSQRRNFLKYFLIAGIGFLAGKFLDSLLGLFSSKKSELKSSKPVPGEKTVTFENFLLKEDEKELNFYDKEGNKILVIEK